jgi:hypothetical protein
MSKSHRSNRERKAARAIAVAQGISYQAAIHQLRSRQGPASPYAERRVREMLDSIAAERWLNLHVPHGFRTDVVFSQQHPNLFSAAIGHVEVEVGLTLPVVYTAKNGRAHKATHSNLDALRGWIEHRAGYMGIKLVGWQVKPDEDPEPKGDPNGPDQHWRVLATFEDHHSYQPLALVSTSI